MGKYNNINLDLEAYQLIRRRKEEGLRYFMTENTKEVLFKTAWAILGSEKNTRPEELVRISEELAQDAFIKLWEHPEKFDPRKNIPSCLRQEVRFRALNKLKNIKRVTFVPIEETKHLPQETPFYAKQEMKPREEQYIKFIYQSNAINPEAFACARYKFEHPALSDREVAQALGYPEKEGVRKVRKYRYLVKRRFLKAFPHYK